MSVISGAYNETYNKPANLLHLFDNSGGNNYKPYFFSFFLVIIITLRLTCGEKKLVKC